MFEAFTDWHSHILPGVDDGIKTMKESLATLEAYEQQGITKVWLTPHIMEDCPNTTEKLRERFAELKAAYNGPIELRLASENMLDSLFQERVRAKDFLPIGDEGRHLLVETSYVSAPYGMEKMIEDAFSIGYTVVLAHPERYQYMDQKDYRAWKERGVLFQGNFFSLIGGYGEVARKKAEWLMKEGMYDLVGSDVHRKAQFSHNIEKHPRKASTLNHLVQVAQNPALK